MFTTEKSFIGFNGREFISAGQIGNLENQLFTIEQKKCIHAFQIGDFNEAYIVYTKVQNIAKREFTNKILHYR